jgi:hypothetical protein
MDRKQMAIAIVAGHALPVLSQSQKTLIYYLTHQSSVYKYSHELTQSEDRQL